MEEMTLLWYQENLSTHNALISSWTETLYFDSAPVLMLTDNQELAALSSELPNIFSSTESVNG